MPQEFEYFAILTNKGTEKMAAYLQSGKKIEIAFVSVGDGNGQIPMPDPARTALVNEVWRGPAQTVLDQTNKNVIKATSVIPTDVGGWNVREIGLIDGDGELFAIANAPGYPKISIADGINNDMQVGMRVAVSNRDGIIVKVDGSVIIATMKDIEEHDKNEGAHNGHFKDKVIHVSNEDRDRWNNPLFVGTVLANSSAWNRDPDGVTYIQDVTALLPEGTVLPNMDLNIKADPNLIAQMVDKNIGLVAEQSKGKIIIHALRETPKINMYLQISLYRSKTGEEKTYYSNLLGNPGEIGTPLPNPIEKGSIHLENQSSNTQLKIHGTHTNPSVDWDGTRIVRGENAAPIGPTDGVQVADGKITAFDDTNGLQAGVRYIYAYFPRNAAGNYQMSATTAEITIPAEKPLAPSNLAVKNSTDKNAFAATLTWKAQTDVYRDHFAIVRKEGSAPTSLEDGQIVYEGNELTFRDSQNTNFGIEYHWTVFSVNAEGVASDSSPSVSLTIQPIVPEQVTELTATDVSAPEYGYRVMVKCKKAADVNAYKIMVRRKAGEMPATSIDGDLAYEGSNDTFYDLPPFSTQAYHYRVFTVNQAGQLNDKQEGATASVTLTAKEPGAVTNLAATDEKGTTTGSFDLPVVMVEGREAVNRFVTGYVVIQKEGGTPTTEKDGEVIVNKEIDPMTVSKTVDFTKVEQKNGANLFITVFLKNHVGSYFWSSGQTVNLVPEIFPEKPSEWFEIKNLTSSNQWTAPETGWFRIEAKSASGSGASSQYWYEGTGTSVPHFFTGGGGGSGAYAAHEVKLFKGDMISFKVDGSIAFLDVTLSPGKDAGKDGTTAPGNGGVSTGANIENINGINGSPGENDTINGFTTTTKKGGSGGNNNNRKNNPGGKGGDWISKGDGKTYTNNPGATGIRASVKIYRGNTNLLISEQNAQAITTNALAIAALAQKQTGILLSILS